MIKKAARLVLILTCVSLFATVQILRQHGKLRSQSKKDQEAIALKQRKVDEAPTAHSPTKTIPDRGPYRPGDLIFVEEFTRLDLKLWEPVITLSGCGSGEFQIYEKQPENLYVKNGVLYIRPTLTAEKYGEDFILNGNLVLEGCTDSSQNGCNKSAGNGRIINPVMSARLNTRKKFAFMYGKVEIRAKIPSADWTWPAIWLMPKHSLYGKWPKSGEVDILEARGNSLYWEPGGRVHIGNRQVQSSLHYGADRKTDKWRHCHMTKNSDVPFSNAFHTLQFNWWPDRFEFGVDNKIVTRCRPPKKGGFHESGKFKGENLWANASNPTVAPFDDYFYFIVNVAVGGLKGFFGDHYVNKPYKKPWSDGQTHNDAMLHFWNNRAKWMPSWEGGRAAFQIDYIKVWAV